MSDLSDFGGGIDKDDPNPEDEVNKKLSSWLRHDDREVYWDRKKTYGNGTFSVSTERIPDLVIKSKNRNYAVEVKRSEKSSNIYNGARQVFQYWKDLVREDATYEIHGKEVPIDAVLLASDKSIEGHIFTKWGEKDPLRSERSDGAKRAAKYGNLPETEHASTETLNRLLHRFSKEYDDEAVVGIGSLLSSTLDGDDAHPNSAHPAALTFTHGNGSEDSSNVQNWEYIPFYLSR